MPGEFDLVRWITSQQKRDRLVRLPAGDDLAVLDWPADDLLLVGVDQVMEGRHFDLAKHKPHDIGRKVMNRNLSDCAAMGCLPAAAVLAVALPTGFSLEQAKELYRGMKAAADPYYCRIVGGDTGSWDGKLVCSVTILGHSAGLTPVTREGAKPGESIYVTGPLGGSILGRHMTFEPRVAWGRMLARYRPMNTQGVSSMIDLSDGLSRDLRHLCHKYGARLDAAKIPIHADAVELSQQDGRPALDHALHDGEDYELLFTAMLAPPMGTKIGVITEEPEILIDNGGELVDLEARGWEHRIA